MKKKEVIIMLDAGHGGIINGKYQTAGKRSPVWSDGSQLFEGVFNRQIVAGIVSQLESMGIKYIEIAPTQNDVSLSQRVKTANEFAKQHSSAMCIYVSIHSNAGGGKGFEIYTSKGETKSDLIADFFAQEFKNSFPDSPLRADYSDGDADKESNFYVLRKTIMPAVLTENFFMDNEQECKTILMTEQGQNKIIDFHVKAIQRAVKEFES